MVIIHPSIEDDEDSATGQYKSTICCPVKKLAGRRTRHHEFVSCRWRRQDDHPPLPRLLAARQSHRWQGKRGASARWSRPLPDASVACIPPLRGRRRRPPLFERSSAASSARTRASPTGWRSRSSSRGEAFRFASLRGDKLWPPCGCKAWPRRHGTVVAGSISWSRARPLYITECVACWGASSRLAGRFGSRALRAPRIVRPRVRCAACPTTCCSRRAGSSSRVGGDGSSTGRGPEARRRRSSSSQSAPLSRSPAVVPRGALRDCSARRQSRRLRVAGGRPHRSFGRAVKGGGSSSSSVEPARPLSPSSEKTAARASSDARPPAWSRRRLTETPPAPSPALSALRRRQCRGGAARTRR